MPPDWKESTPAEHIVLNHIQIHDLAGHVWLDWRILRHTNKAVNSQYASTWDIWIIASGDKNSQGTPQPKRAVSA